MSLDSYIYSGALLGALAGALLQANIRAAIWACLRRRELWWFVSAGAILGFVLGKMGGAHLVT